MTQNTHSTTMTPNITHNPQPQTLSSNVAQISNICTVSSTYCTTSIQCSTEPSTSTLSPNRAQNMHTEKVPVEYRMLYSQYTLHHGVPIQHRTFLQNHYTTTLLTEYSLEPFFYNTADPIS